MNLLAKFDQKQIEKLDRNHPEFGVGDTIKIMVKIVEGGNERAQAYQGVVIRIKNRAMGSTFTVKKDSHGESIERTFLYYSPRLEKIEVIKRGKVRRSKLYYMRERTGKAARIAEKAVKVTATTEAA
jgi:large subunit ribosomal protein L19